MSNPYLSPPVYHSGPEYEPHVSKTQLELLAVLSKDPAMVNGSEVMSYVKRKRSEL